MDYSYYYDAAARRSTHAAASCAVQRLWLRNLPYEVREGDVTFCRSSPIASRSSSTSSRSSRQAALPSISGTKARYRDVHRSLAPVQVVRADARRGVRGVATKFVIGEHRYIISVGSVGQPRDYDNRAVHVYGTEGVFEFKRVAYDRRRGAEDLRSRARAKLRESSVPRRLITFVGGPRRGARRAGT
jgi:diadenosine tetraphosphatase ApaH/serine/threonine PP2A family protein phosphatase